MSNNVNKKISREEIILTPLPMRTYHYTPISHRDIIESILEEIDKHNLIIKNEDYKSASNGQKIIGYFDIDNNNDEMGMRIAFRNSYDKSMSFAMCSGTAVWICENGCVSGEFQMKRKHTGLADYISDNYIKDSINLLGDVFEDIQQASLLLKQRELRERKAAELIGRLLVENEILNGMQAGIVRDELYGSKNFMNLKENELISSWDFYNHVTESLKRAHPLTYIKDHSNFHQFMMDEFE